MPTPTLTQRRFTGNGDGELVYPVDALGHARLNVLLDSAAVTRDDDDDDVIGFRGHAAMFNSRTWIGSRSKAWGFYEQIGRGAFAKTIGEADVRFLINHDPNLLLARNTANTLRLDTDDTGLAVDADMAPVTYARDIAVSLERGDISQMSFAFTPLEWRFTEAEDGNDLYIITELRLWDVSVVTYPAYEDTDAGLRGASFDVLAEQLGFDDEQRGQFLRSVNEGDQEQISQLVSARTTSSTDDGPPEGTRTGDEDPGPPEGTRDDSPPGESTGSTRNRLALQHRTRQTKENLS